MSPPKSQRLLRLIDNAVEEKRIAKLYYKAASKEYNLVLKNLRAVKKGFARDVDQMAVLVSLRKTIGWPTRTCIQAADQESSEKLEKEASDNGIEVVEKAENESRIQKTLQRMQEYDEVKKGKATRRRNLVAAKDKVADLTSETEFYKSVRIDNMEELQKLVELKKLGYWSVDQVSFGSKSKDLNMELTTEAEQAGLKVQIFPGTPQNSTS